jgi:hypothetical protein
VHYLENQESISLFKVQLLTDKLEAKRIIRKLRWININNKLMIKVKGNLKGYKNERTKEEKEIM